MDSEGQMQLPDDDEEDLCRVWDMAMDKVKFFIHLKEFLFYLLERVMNSLPQNCCIRKGNFNTIERKMKWIKTCHFVINSVDNFVYYSLFVYKIYIRYI